MISVLVVIIGGRVIPLFTGNWLGIRIQPLPASFEYLTLAVTAVIAIGFATTSGSLPPPWLQALCLLGAALQLLAVSRILKYLGVRVALLALPVIALGGYAVLAFGAALGVTLNHGCSSRALRLVSVVPAMRKVVSALVATPSVSGGAVALTKVDLVESEFAELAAEEVRELLASTAFAEVPVVPVSAHTGQGLAELRRVLQRTCRRLCMAQKSRDSVHRRRTWTYL